MHWIAVYPRGFGFSLQTTTRYELSPEDEDEADMHGPFNHWPRAAEKAARFGIEYSDGRRATLDDAPTPHAGKAAKDGISIWPGGGGGGGGHWTTELWVQPLPPPGPVTFAVEWQAKGIDETLHELEGQQFRDAAERAKRVFPSRRS